NIAGDTVNMASRVMDLADAGQIFLTQMAHNLIVNFIPSMEQQFREYRQAQIKHNERIDVYQYIDERREGLDVSPKAGLGLAADALETAAQIRPSEPTPVTTEDSESKPLDDKPMAAD